MIEGHFGKKATIQSDNPYQIAAASDGVYQDPIDHQNMKSAIKVYIRNLLAQLALVNPLQPYYKPIPINAVIAANYSGAEVEKYVKDNTNLGTDARHFTSHCKMAPLNAGGVVGGNTPVYGTTNCFVVDNSICPKIPNINTTASAQMIGKRASEILKTVLRKE